MKHKYEHNGAVITYSLVTLGKYQVALSANTLFVINGRYRETYFTGAERQIVQNTWNKSHSHRHYCPTVWTVTLILLKVQKHVTGDRSDCDYKILHMNCDALTNIISQAPTATVDPTGSGRNLPREYYQASFNCGLSAPNRRRCT
jgi:hypothetical protein